MNYTQSHLDPNPCVEHSCLFCLNLQLLQPAVGKNTDCDSTPGRHGFSPSPCSSSQVGTSPSLPQTQTPRLVVTASPPTAPNISRLLTAMNMQKGLIRWGIITIHLFYS